MGQLAGAQRAVDRLALRGAPAASRAIAELIRAEIAVRQLHSVRARVALERARRAARASAIPALQREVERAQRALTTPAARVMERGESQALSLAEVQNIVASAALIVDACRRAVQRGRQRVTFTRKPVLFALLRCLAEAWPKGAAREVLILHGFGVRQPNPSHRARLRVEIGRLRKLLGSVATVRADARGFALDVSPAKNTVVIAPPNDGGALLALLSDGAAWSTSALALALGSSQRTVQRTLLELAAAHKVRGVGRARAKRWLAASLGEIATALLLLPVFPDFD